MEPANKYISLFHNPLMAIIARCLAYISGALVATLLLTSIFEQGALLYVKIGDHNLLWYLGLFSALFAGARSLIPDEAIAMESPKELMEQVTSHTHYYPQHWRGCEHKQKVRVQLCMSYGIYVYHIYVHKYIHHTYIWYTCATL